MVTLDKGFLVSHFNSFDTRQHYQMVGDSIKKMPKNKRQKEFEKWDALFSRDNPSYDSYRLAKSIGLV
jgi:hypothetical protein|tara:strand:+ start:258 stop:461 length:204 start_codon:yes stop_codon:yes gene_type:complete